MEGGGDNGRKAGGVKRPPRSSVLCLARLVGENENTDIPIPGNPWELLVDR